MDSKKYQEESGATDNRDYTPIQDRVKTEEASRLIHYIIGVGSEAGELQDQLKKHLIYGKELDKTNLIEESGDVLWYLSRMLKLLGSSLEEAMEKNNSKLKARYGDAFTEHAALNRNLEKERNILEKDKSSNK